MALHAEQIADIVNSTRRRVRKNRWTDLMTAIRKFTYMPRILQDEKIRLGGGRGPEDFVTVRHLGAAHHTGLFAIDQVQTGDVLKKIYSDWKHTTTHWAYEEREERINSGPEALVDVVLTRRHSALVSLAELMEESFWVNPTSYTGDDPYPVWHWIVKWPAGASSPTSGGYLGTNPVDGSGTTYTASAGNLSSSTYPYWANWAAQYSNFTPDDVVDKMRKAAEYTNFEPPFDYPELKRGGDDRGIYCNWETKAELRKVAESMNDNLGFDLGGGQVLFQGTPLMVVPKLDDDASDPIVGINWAHFYPYFLEGEWMKETAPLRAPYQHRTWVNFIDLTHQTFCHNRREQWVLSKLSSTDTSS